MLEINRVAKKLGIKESELIPYGKYKAKVSLDVLKRVRKKAKVILVTTITQHLRAREKQRWQLA